MAAIHKFDAIVIGAGAAGLLCAIEAGKKGRRIAILERSERAGKKILISGGGRCNFTNLHCGPEHFISSNPHFAKSALARYSPSNFISMVESHRIPFHEKARGQLFCDRSAEDIVKMLEGECGVAGVSIFLNCDIREVQRTTEFIVRTSSTEFRSPALVIATGGLSIRKIGATGFGYEVARQFGLSIRPTRPALVPLVLGDEDRGKYCDLAGISTEVETFATEDSTGTGPDATCTRSFRDKMLITHRGLSGPAILQISSYWNTGQPISIDLAPDCNLTATIRSAKTRNLAAARAAFHGVLPQRLATRWLELHAPSTWTNQALAVFEREIHQWTILPAGTEGYDKAEVTAGGVDTEELSSQTMESRTVPGLFFVGEVVDVTGQLGGYNFQWAWASGAAAGRAV